MAFLQRILRPARGGRIAGIDVARSAAMFGMVVVHFVVPWQEEGVLSSIAGEFSGRAMPLFMLLGGIGVSLLTARSATPDRDLLIRAAMLMALGLVLNEMVDEIAIVLQSYGLFFVLATGLRRLPTAVLPAIAVGFAAVGAYTYQVVGDPSAFTAYDNLFTSTEGLQALFFDGYYPAFPVAAFFTLGLWLGRLDLRSDRLAAVLAGVGLLLGIGVRLAAPAAIAAVDAGPSAFDEADRLFRWEALLLYQGHTEMPAWVLSTTGTSLAVLGISLLIAPRLGAAARPLIAVGSTALTFYVAQALLTLVFDSEKQTTVEEWRTAIGIYLVYMVAAFAWKLRFKSGPLERLLRVGAGPRLEPATSITTTGPVPSPPAPAFQAPPGQSPPGRSSPVPTGPPPLADRRLPDRG